MHTIHNMKATLNVPEIPKKTQINLSLTIKFNN